MEIPINKIMNGDALTHLKELPSESINCCMTSPPYWSLRDYGSLVEIIWDAKEGCEHEFEIKERYVHRGSTDVKNSIHAAIHNENLKVDWKVQEGFCTKCNAWKGQLGLEPTFDLYIKHLCDIFDEVKRVLRKDGTCWVNIGDTYCGGHPGGSTHIKDSKYDNPDVIPQIKDGRPAGKLKDYNEKCMISIPARFQLEMINRGWILRNTIIWHKPNCMPSSVKDRFTVDFEYIFFFVKNKKYWFETQYENSLYKTEIPEEISDRNQYLINKLYKIKRDIRDEKIAYSGKSVNLNNYNNALANAKAYRTGLEILQNDEHLTKEEIDFLKDYTQNHFSRPEGRNKRTVWTITTKPFKEAHFATYPEELCETPIKAGCPVNGIVLDPFFGAGTTGLVALKQKKQFIGIELNPEYIKIAKERLKPYLEQEVLPI